MRPKIVTMWRRPKRGDQAAPAPAPRAFGTGWDGKLSKRPRMTDAERRRKR